MSKNKNNISWFKALFSADSLPERSSSEIWTSSIGAFVAIILIAWGSGLVLSGTDVPLMVTSMGAAAVLVFAAPRSTISQPWPLIGGHFISAFVGVSCAKFIPGFALTAALAVGLSILCMHLAHCLHPPGGATALAAVVGGESIQSLGYEYLLAPVGLNVLIMFVVALLINNLVPGLSYPVRKVGNRGSAEESD